MSLQNKDAKVPGKRSGKSLVSLIIMNERGGSDGTGSNFTAESERSVGPFLIQYIADKA